MLTVTNNDGKVIGFLNAETFTKHVKKSKHLFRKANAWAVDTAALEKALKAGANMLEIIDLDEEKHYLIEAAKFAEHGKVINFGYGEQKLLPLRYFNVFNKFGQTISKGDPLS